MSIHLTRAQALALTNIAAREGDLVLHQLAHDVSTSVDEDVYAAAVGHEHTGYRITADGRVGPLGESVVAHG